MGATKTDVHSAWAVVKDKRTNEARVMPGFKSYSSSRWEVLYENNDMVKCTEWKNTLSKK